MGMEEEELENIGAFSVTLTTSVNEEARDIAKLTEQEDQGCLLKRVLCNYFFYIGRVSSLAVYWNALETWIPKLWRWSTVWQRWSMVWRRWSMVEQCGSSGRKE